MHYFTVCILYLGSVVAIFAAVPTEKAVGKSEGKSDSKIFFSNWFQKTTTPSGIVQEYFRTCPCSCGLRNDETRIVGGHETKPNEYPWMVQLHYLNTFYCGGTLINDRYVLTAAHCIRGHFWFLIKLILGQHDRCDATAKPESRFVLRALQGDFSFTNFQNDIALLRLNDKVTFNNRIRPICLPLTTSNLYVNVTAKAMGWGTLREEGSPSCTLNEVDLQVMSNQDCKKTNYEASLISDKMMCAGTASGGKDTCQGDSGGPLVYERDTNKFEAIGIVSWGMGCGRPGYPGIYTRLPSYVNWIIERTKDACYCQH